MKYWNLIYALLMWSWVVMAAVGRRYGAVADGWFVALALMMEGLGAGLWFTERRAASSSGGHVAALAVFYLGVPLLALAVTLLSVWMVGELPSIVIY